VTAKHYRDLANRQERGGRGQARGKSSLNRSDKHKTGTDRKMGNTGQAQVEDTRHKQDCSWQGITKRCRLFGLTQGPLI
jgi:hypothetical protein